MVRILRTKAIRGSVQQSLHINRARPVTLTSRRYSSADANSIGGLEDPFTYCRNFVRQHDRDSYLTSQFFPKNLQGFCFAVRAFYVSISFRDFLSLVHNFDLSADRIGNDTGLYFKRRHWRNADAVLEGCRKEHFRGKYLCFYLVSLAKRIVLGQATQASHSTCSS